MLLQVDIADWPPASVLVPSNIRGAYNGLSAPFPRWDPRMLCSIDNMVRDPLVSGLPDVVLSRAAST